MISFCILHTHKFMVVIILIWFLGVWVFGFFKDKIDRAGQKAERQSVMRREVWHHHNDHMV